MEIKAITSWVEDHPTESIVIGLGGTLALLWLFGFFSSNNQSADTGQSSLASAYYAAEAQQAVVGGQIQMATIGAAASTAQAGIAADAAVKINAAQTHGAVMINGQNASAATTINKSNNDAAMSINNTASNDQLLATYSNNGALMHDTDSNNNAFISTTASNNAAQIAINANNNQTSLYNTFMGSLVAPEMAAHGSADITVPGLGRIVGNSNMTPNISALMAMGYTNAQAVNYVQQSQGARF